LLQALIFADANAIKENSVKLGAGEDLYALFAGILTMRPWNRVVDSSVDHLVVQGTDNDRSELQVIFCPRNLSLLIVSTYKNSCQIYMLIKLHTLSLSSPLNVTIMYHIVLEYCFFFLLKGTCYGLLLLILRWGGWS
jgi:hypothetical protein